MVECSQGARGIQEKVEFREKSNVQSTYSTVQANADRDASSGNQLITGCEAVLPGLQKHELNSLSCELLAYEKEAGRWQVKPEDGRKLKVKPQNLKSRQLGSQGYTASQIMSFIDRGLVQRVELFDSFRTLVTSVGGRRDVSIVHMTSEERPTVLEKIRTSKVAMTSHFGKEFVSPRAKLAIQRLAGRIQE